MNHPLALIVEDDPTLIGHDRSGQTFGIYAELLADRVTLLHASGLVEARAIADQSGTDLEVVVLDGYVVGGTTETLAAWLHERFPGLPMIAASSNDQMRASLLRHGCIMEAKAKSDVPDLVLDLLNRRGRLSQIEASAD
jgi:hypothetical protein